MSSNTKIGEWMIGHRNVELLVDRELLGGSFILAPEKGVAQITVGTRYDEWHEVLEVLMHECLELSFCDIGVRFKANPTLVNGHDGYVFIADHNQFTDAVIRATYFVSQCQHDLCKIHRKHRAARRK